MSGGAYDYKFEELKHTYVGKMHDIELDALMKDLIPLLKELEWWQSGDTSQEDYRSAVKKFKDKWLSTEPKDRVNRLIDETLSEASEKLKTSLLYELEREDYSW